MKKLLLPIICLIALKATGQCGDCSSFEEALKKPETVKSISINQYLHKIKLDSVPSFIGSFINLEMLFLTDQNIHSIPSEIGKLTRLKELSFGGCKLTEIPDAIFLLKNLKELVLFDNPFPEKYKKELEIKLKKELPNTKIRL
jgi:Leucine-rich repeat (LRR) protein